MPILEQLLIRNSEERSMQRRVDRQLIVRPLDRRERGADRLDFFAAVKRLATDEELCDSARLEGLHILSCDVDSHFFETSEQDADVLRLNPPATAVQKPL